MFPSCNKKMTEKKIQTNVVKRIKPEEEQQITTGLSKWLPTLEASSQITFQLFSHTNSVIATCIKDEYMIALCLCVWLWESCRRCTGRGSDQGKGCSSIWLALCCLPKPATCRGKALPISKAGYWSESSCHWVSSSSGPREHLSLSLNWIQSLIKALFKGVRMVGTIA